MSIAIKSGDLVWWHELFFWIFEGKLKNKTRQNPMFQNNEDKTIYWLECGGDINSHLKGLEEKSS